GTQAGRESKPGPGQQTEWFHGGEATERNGAFSTLLMKPTGRAIWAESSPSAGETAPAIIQSRAGVRANNSTFRPPSGLLLTHDANDCYNMNALDSSSPVPRCLFDPLQPGARKSPVLE